MNPKNEKEVYDLADAALARLHEVRDDPEKINEHGQSIEKSLETIRRRTDPARHPDYEP